MNQRKVLERYKQLRILITRAKEDAERWGTNQPALVMRGIKELSPLDYTVYDEAYHKFVSQRVKRMSDFAINEANSEELDKITIQKRIEGKGASETELLLKRIAEALERIADQLEEQE